MLWHFGKEKNKQGERQAKKKFDERTSPPKKSSNRKSGEIDEKERGSYRTDPRRWGQTKKSAKVKGEF